MLSRNTPNRRDVVHWVTALDNYFIAFHSPVSNCLPRGVCAVSSDSTSKGLEGRDCHVYCVMIHNIIMRNQCISTVGGQVCPRNIDDLAGLSWGTIIQSEELCID